MPNTPVTTKNRPAMKSPRGVLRRRVPVVAEDITISLSGLLEVLAFDWRGSRLRAGSSEFSMGE